MIFFSSCFCKLQFATALIAGMSSLWAASPAPERLLSHSAALANPAMLPEIKGRHAVAFRGKPGESGFNLHSYLAHANGHYWLCWSSAKVNEEDPDQQI